MDLNKVEIKECDFSMPEETQALITLLNHYKAGPMGGSLHAYSKQQEADLVKMLGTHPSKLILLARYEKEFIGLANCFINIGTFAVKPFINIHDIVVLEEYRGKGIGRQLLDTIVSKAKELGCGKITLEVRDDNISAQALYKSFGFDESKPVMHFWTKYL